MKFLHTADLHLGRPLQTVATESPLSSFFREAPYRSLETLVEYAIEQSVDGVLFAGDSLDSRWCTNRVKQRFNQQLSRLLEEDIEVLLVGGDADPVGREEVPPPLPEAVKRFSSENPEVVECGPAGETVEVVGCSYHQTRDPRNLIEAIANQTPAGGGRRVGFVHSGLGGGSGSLAFGSLQKGQESPIEYWALGHRHRCRRVDADVPAAYPGSPQGRNPAESGLGGCLLVTVEEASPRIEFLPTSPLVWRRQRIDLNEVESPPDSLDELADLMIRRADELRKQPPRRLAERKQEYTGIPCREPKQPPEGFAVRWVVSGRTRLHEEIQERENPRRALEKQLRQEFRDGDPFLWTESVRFHTSSDRPGLDELARRERVFAEFADLLEGYEDDQLLSELRQRCGKVWHPTEDPEATDEDRIPLDEERLRGLLDRAIDRVSDRILLGTNNDVD